MKARQDLSNSRRSLATIQRELIASASLDVWTAPSSEPEDSFPEDSLFDDKSLSIDRSADEEVDDSDNLLPSDDVNNF